MKQPMRVPLIGNTLSFNIFNPQQTLLRLAEQFGAVYRVDFGLFKNPMVCVSTPELVEHIFKHDNVELLKGPGYEAIWSVTPKHLLVMEGAEWERCHRGLLAHMAFVAKAVPGVALGASAALAERLTGAGDGAVRCAELMRSFALDVVARILLGPAGAGEESLLRALSDSPDESVGWLQTITSEWHLRVLEVVPFSKLRGAFKLPRVRKVERSQAKLRAFFETHYESPHAESLLARLKATDGLSKEDVIETIMFTFLAMGHENVASHMSWLLYSIANDEALQAAIRAEVTADQDGGVKSPTLDKAIKEALRLYPSIPMLSRVSQKPFELPGFGTVAAGEEILVSPYVTQRLKSVWGERANEFDASRWDAKPEPYSFFPHGMGQRSCVGRALGHTETKVVVSQILKRFRVTVAEHAKQGLFISLRPGKLRLRFAPIADAPATAL
eukprot:CAMPEP_0170153716 /NCGR_PEP_ID=MMETSP0033_2-20121228/56073_1 /TAXON_ID=195969 /ORGANISM="Dolichomastix tenuilepis, Strain CCMP3274" /LENGTH=442 /DNA_ID=CAMNT_0010390933 /DNA_START=246 /DNA_END=1574 /DNA_ORIENTATION=-